MKHRQSHLCVQLTSSKYIHIVVQTFSWTFSSCKIETVPLNNSSLSPPPAPSDHILFSVSMIDYSRKLTSCPCERLRGHVAEGRSPLSCLVYEGPEPSGSSAETPMEIGEQGLVGGPQTPQVVYVGGGFLGRRGITVDLGVLSGTAGSL